MYNVYGSQNEFVERVTRVFILRMRSLEQNGPVRRDTVFAVARIVMKFGRNLDNRPRFILRVKLLLFVTLLIVNNFLLD